MSAVETLLIGLDGATFTVLDPLMERGLMPNLRRLVEGGVRAPLRTVIPPLTPPAWTSVMTGKRPGQHGVLDFFQKESADSEYFRFSSSDDVRSSTIWSLASEHGRRVISLNFPLMFPPPDVAGCVVPGGWMPWRQLRLGCHPAGLFDRLKTLPSFNPRELALDMTLEAKAIEGCPADEYAEWIELHGRREERWLEILRFLLREEPAELVGVVFDGVDKLQHLCWRFLDPAFRPQQPSAWEREVTALCEAYFRRLDEMVGELVELAGPQATVVIASDHGFAATRDVFYVNAWLEQQGYLAWADAAPASEDAAPEVGFRRMMRHVYELDWSRTLAYAATPSSQGIHVVSRVPGSEDPLPEAERARIVQELAAALAAVEHPLDGGPLVREVWTREAAFAGPHEALAPDLTLTLDDGAAVSILRSDELVRRRPEVKGNHRWDGILVAHGPGVRRGVALDELSILDVAPLVLYGLDLPVPDDLEGRVPLEAYDAEAVDRRPPRTQEAALPAAVGASAGGEAYDVEDEATMVSRLRALGYVE